MSFLNSILKLEGDRLIKKLEYLPQKQVPIIKDFKRTFIDLKCTDERNVEYVAMIQNNKVPDFIKRSQFYLTHCCEMEFPAENSNYLKLESIVFLAIENHILFPEKKNVVSYYKPLDGETLAHNFYDLVYVFVEIPKFIKTEGEIETPLEQWMYFFRNWDKTKEVPKTIQEPEIIEAYNTMEKFNWTLAEQDWYLQATISVIDEMSRLEEGFKKGYKEGLKKAEKEKTLATAKELLKKGLSPDQVSRMTELSPQDVKSLVEERV